ncbi:MAG TPA: cyclic nucleotide-binding domain-containing protein [Dissulfurispiraceae bacterium]
MESDDKQGKIAEALRKIDFFNEFSDTELTRLLEITQWVKYSGGDIIIQEGATEKTFYVIIKGRVSIKKRMGGVGLKKNICTLSMGQSFGEMSSFITGKPRSADIIAEEDTFVLRFNADDIHRERENPQYTAILFKFYKKFAEVLAERLEEADQEIINPPM